MILAFPNRLSVNVAIEQLLRKLERMRSPRELYDKKQAIKADDVRRGLLAAKERLQHDELGAICTVMWCAGVAMGADLITEEQLAKCFDKAKTRRNARSAGK